MTAATTIVRQPALASSPQPTPTARALIAQCTKGARPRRWGEVSGNASPLCGCLCLKYFPASIAASFRSRYVRDFPSTLIFEARTQVFLNHVPLPSAASATSGGANSDGHSHPTTATPRRPTPLSRAARATTIRGTAATANETAATATISAWGFSNTFPIPEVRSRRPQSSVRYHPRYI